MKKIICTAAVLLFAIAAQAQARQEKTDTRSAGEQQVKPAAEPTQQPTPSKKTAKRKQAGTAETQSQAGQKNDAAAKQEKNQGSARAASQAPPVQQETIMPDGTSVPVGSGERQAGATDKQATPASQARRADGKAAAAQNAAPAQPTDARKAAQDSKSKAPEKGASETSR